MARVALVTGGSRGIGAAISVALQAAGYKVAANYAGNDEAAQRSRARPASRSSSGTWRTSRPARPGIAQVEAELGPVEVLVNNAGITRDAMFHRMSREQWQEVISTNLDGLFNMTRPGLGGHARRASSAGSINISSINGQKGQFGQANYAAAKAGDIGFTKALAQEGAAAGITVNASARAISAPRWSARCPRTC